MVSNVVTNPQAVRCVRFRIVHLGRSAFSRRHVLFLRSFMLTSYSLLSSDTNYVTATQVGSYHVSGTACKYFLRYSYLYCIYSNKKTFANHVPIHSPRQATNPILVISSTVSLLPLTH
jgi:hypothetical protein